MKRILLAILILSILFFTACSDIPTASPQQKELLEVREVPAHMEIITEYEYKWSWWHGDFKYLPNTYSVSYPTTYEGLYRIYHYDGTHFTQWDTISKEIYESFKK